MCKRPTKKPNLREVEVGVFAVVILTIWHFSSLLSTETEREGERSKQNRVKLRRTFGFGIVRCLIIMGFDMTSINLIHSTLLSFFLHRLSFSFLSPLANSRIQLIILTTDCVDVLLWNCKEVIARLKERRNLM
jgi:hypothetical protein